MEEGLGVGARVVEEGLCVGAGGGAILRSFSIIAFWACTSCRSLEVSLSSLGAAGSKTYIDYWNLNLEHRNLSRTRQCQWRICRQPLGRRGANDLRRVGLDGSS